MTTDAETLDDLRRLLKAAESLLEVRTAEVTHWRDHACNNALDAANEREMNVTLVQRCADMAVARDWWQQQASVHLPKLLAAPLPTAGHVGEVSQISGSVEYRISQHPDDARDADAAPAPQTPVDVVVDALGKRTVLPHDRARLGKALDAANTPVDTDVRAAQDAAVARAFRWAYR